MTTETKKSMWMSVLGAVATAITTVEKGCSKYTDTMDKAEQKVMTTCGCDIMIDDYIEHALNHVGPALKKGAGTVRDATVSCATKVAPMVKLVSKTKTTEDILNELAADEDLAAALRYVHLNPCIRVAVTEIKDSKDVVVDGRAPMAKPSASRGKAYMPAMDKTPGKKSGLAKIKSFMSKMTGPRMATCVVNK